MWGGGGGGLHLALGHLKSGGGGANTQAGYSAYQRSSVGNHTAPPWSSTGPAVPDAQVTQHKVGGVVGKSLLRACIPRGRLRHTNPGVAEGEAGDGQGPSSSEPGGTVTK